MNNGLSKTDADGGHMTSGYTAKTPGTDADRTFAGSRADAMVADNEEIRADVRIRFARSRPYFGKGTAMLLREIDRCGNVREACANCGFSYSKGWTILSRCEKGLGYKVVDRQQGGENGGKAALNDTGRRLLNIFEQLYEEVSTHAEKRFRELMEEQGLAGRSSKDTRG